jgi:hypothetical protein
MRFAVRCTHSEFGQWIEIDHAIPGQFSHAASWTAEESAPCPVFKLPRLGGRALFGRFTSDYGEKYVAILRKKV